jgi:hypothetical protein
MRTLHARLAFHNVTLAGDVCFKCNGMVRAGALERIDYESQYGRARVGPQHPRRVTRPSCDAAQPRPGMGGGSVSLPLGRATTRSNQAATCGDARMISLLSGICRM